MNIQARIASCLVTTCCIALSASAETYYLCGNDTGTYSSMDGTSKNTAGWSLTPGGARTKACATAGNDYIIDNGYRINSPAQASYMFPGDSLTIVSGSIAMNSSTTAISELDLTNCTVTGSATMSNAIKKNSTITLGGDITVQDGAVLTLATSGKGGSDSRHIIVKAALSGAGALELTSSTSSGSGTPTPSITFDGTSLADFTGPLSVVVLLNTGTFTLNFLTPGAFPAETGVADADSVTFDNVPTVKFEASGSFGENRGVKFVTATPTLYVAEGKTVVFNGMTSGDVGFTKTGAGDLILSNDVQTLTGTVTVKAGLLFYKPALAKSATIVENGGAAIELESSVKAIEYTCTGYEGVADGEAHGITVTVTDPADGAGCAYEWSVDGGETWQAEKPMFEAPCRQTVFCRITASGYAPCICNAEVLIRYRGTVYVSPTGSETFPYDEPAKAAHDIASALFAVADGQTVSVGAGTYTQPAVVSVGGGVSLRGPGDRSAIIKTHGFNLSDGAALSGVTFDGLAQRAAYVPSGCVVSNCLFCNASVASVGLYGTLVDSEIRDCGGNGSAVGFSGPDARMIRTKVLHVCGGGAAIEVSGDAAATLYMEDCTVAGCTNSNSEYSSAVFNHGGSGALVLNRCRFTGNRGRRSIGRVSTSTAWVCATNCLFVSNWSAKTGSTSQYDAMGFFDMGNGNFVNCTFADNSGANSASLFTVRNGCNVEVVNCVISGNEPLYCGTGRISYDHTMYPTADGTSGNITGPAVFKGKGSDPYRLDSASPGIGMGLLLNWTKGDVDLAGRPRVRGGNRVDMGCYSVSGQGFCLFVW